MTPLPFCRVVGCAHRRRPNKVMCRRCYEFLDSESRARVDSPSAGVLGEQEIAVAIGTAGDILRHHLEAKIEEKRQRTPRWYHPPTEAAE